MSQGGPAKTTLTPAYLSYQASFLSGKWGQGAAIAYILFAIIVIFSLVQRFVMRDRATLPRRRRFTTWEGKRAPHCPDRRWPDRSSGPRRTWSSAGGGWAG